MIAAEGAAPLTVRDGDGIILFNFRADRMRQIVRALMDPSFDGFDVRPRPAVDVVTMTMYDETFTAPVAFPPFTLARIVAEVVSERGMSMLRTAETEKYAHVTYFFNGGYETPYPGEVRELVPSQQVATYDLAPGDERRRRDRCALPRDHRARLRLPARELRERRHGGAHRGDPGGDHRGGDGGPLPGARASRPRRPRTHGCS